MAKIYGELERAQLENLAADPTPALAGRIFYQTTDTIPKYDTGAAIKTFVDTTSTQVITGKDIDGGTASNTSRITIPKGTTAALTALTRKEGTVVYSTDEDTLLIDDGTSLSALGGGSSGINYIEANYTFESGTTGWTAYADAAGATPVDGTGGSPNSSIAQVTTGTLLRGTAALEFTKNSGASRQGEGFSRDFTIDNADKASMLEISFDYSIDDSDYTDGDIGVFIYDVTNTNIIRVVPEDIYGNAQGHFKAQFQTASNSTSYRLILHITTATDYAATFRFDNFELGPPSYGSISPVTDPIAVTITGNAQLPNLSVATGWYYRVGKYMHFYGTIESAGTGGGASNIAITIPDNYSADTTYTPDATGTEGGGLDGGGTYYDGTNIQTVAIALNGATEIFFPIPTGSGTAAVTGTGTLGASGSKLTFRAVIPIVGWGSNITVADIDSQRVVAARVSGINTSSIASATSRYLYFGTGKEFDTHAALTLGSAHSANSAASAGTGTYFRAPESGYYAFSTGVAVDTGGANYDVGDVFTLGVTKNTTQVAHDRKNGMEASQNIVLHLSINDMVYLTKGDYLEVLFTNNQGATNAFNGTTGRNWFSVHKVQGPSQPLAGEKVFAFYERSTAQTIANDTATNMNWDTRITDTHSAVTTGASWKFTAPKTDYYDLDCFVLFASGGGWAVGERAELRYFINGTLKRYLCTEYFKSAHSQYVELQGSIKQLLNKGDYIEIKIYQNSGADLDTNANAQTTYIAISN